MRLRSFGMIGVAAAVVLGCGGAGSGAGGPLGGGTTPGAGDQPPNSSDTPMNSNSAPTNPNQPGNNTSMPANGTLCESACDLALKYPCYLSMNCSSAVGIDGGAHTTNCTPVTQEQCLNECESSLASATPSDLACGIAALAVLKCADRYGDAMCPADGGDVTFTTAILQDCANEYQDMQQACGTSQGCGPADSCDGCMCQNPNNPQACTDVCQTPNGSCTPQGQCSCPDPCSECLCTNNNDPTQCTTQCAG